MKRKGRVSGVFTWSFYFFWLGPCEGFSGILSSQTTSHSMINSMMNDVDPYFSEAIANVTVPIGREAVLSCSVTDLGHYKVGWLKAEDQTVLTLHNKVVTHNSRIGVTHDSANTWLLRIRQVKESDRGCYMCQINTNKMKKQLGCVDVHVPPDIIDEETSSDVTVREGENATLVCRAKGHPVPRIIWKREDGDHLQFKSGSKEIMRADSYMSDTYSLTKVSRSQMGAYLCIASNDVPPAVSKRVVLNINFAPSIKIPNQLLGAPLGTNVLLECHVEAFPNTINYWIKNRGEMLLNGKKHIIEEEKNSYKVHLKLTVANFSKSDLGTYMCVSTNSLGRADGTVRLYEIKVPTKMPITTTTETSLTYQVAVESTTQERAVEVKRKFIQYSTTLGNYTNSAVQKVKTHQTTMIEAAKDHFYYSINIYLIEFIVIAVIITVTVAIIYFLMTLESFKEESSIDRSPTLEKGFRESDDDDGNEDNENVINMNSMSSDALDLRQYSNSLANAITVLLISASFFL